MRHLETQQDTETHKAAAHRAGTKTTELYVLMRAETEVEVGVCAAGCTERVCASLLRYE